MELIRKSAPYFLVINSVGYLFILRLVAVFVNLGLVLFTVGQASRAADATADARHSFDEVAVENILILLEKCHTACLDSVADDGLDLKIDILLV